MLQNKGARSQADVRIYADEAMRWAAESTTQKEKRALFELARTCSQAAIASGMSPGGRQLQSDRP